MRGFTAEDLLGDNVLGWVETFGLSLFFPFPNKGRAARKH